MTVSELIKTLSALEEQDSEVFISEISIVPVETVEGFSYSLEKSGSPARFGYRLSGNYEPLKTEIIKPDWLAEDCAKRDKSYVEAETKAIQIAVEIINNSTRDGNIRLSDIDWGELRAFLCLVSACRKAVIDGFPLNDYEMGEIPLITDKYLLMYFENKYEYGMGENYNPHAHEIIFQCFFGNPIAVPHRQYNDGTGDDIKECENCFDAVYECGNY